MDWNLTPAALRRSDLQVGSRLRTPPAQIPAATCAALDAAAGRLVALGFELCCYERVQPFVRARCVDTWGATLWNEAWRSFAVLTTTTGPLALHLWSLLRDGSRLLTTNGADASMIGDDGRTKAHDAAAHSIASHCDAHFARLRALPPARHPVRATQPQLADLARDDAGARLANLTAAGDVVATCDGAWRFTRRGALRWSRILRGRAGHLDREGSASPPPVRSRLSRSRSPAPV